jgi:hypothetical protein
MPDDGALVSTEKTIAKIMTKPLLWNALIEAGSIALICNGKNVLLTASYLVLFQVVTLRQLTFIRISSLLQSVN